MAFDMISGAGIDPNAQAKQTNVSELYWTEKYRGKTLDDIILPAKLATMIKTAVSHVGMGNYIFYSGHPGTGKSSLARAIPGMLGARSMFIPPKRSSEIIELIGSYSTLKTNGKPYYFIIDECDHPNNPEDFWRSIQSEVEGTASNLRFIMTCNELWRVPKAVQSRCTPIPFDHSSNDSEFKNRIYMRLKYIADQEVSAHGGQVQKNTIVEIINACFPDIRAMINTMQNTFYENEGNIVGHPRVVTDQMIETVAKYLVMRDTRGLRYYVSMSVDNHLGIYIPLVRYLMDRLPPTMDLHLFKALRDGIVNAQGQVDQESMLMGFFADIIDILNGFQIPAAPLPEPAPYVPQSSGASNGEQVQSV